MHADVLVSTTGVARQQPQGPSRRHSQKKKKMDRKEKKNLIGIMLT